MKPKWFSLLLVLLISVLSIAQDTDETQTQQESELLYKNFRIGAKIGYLNWMDQSLSDALENKFTYGGDITLNVGNNFAIMLGALYINIENEEASISNREILDLEYRQIPLNLSVIYSNRIRENQGTRFYLGAGPTLSFDYMRTSRITTEINLLEEVEYESNAFGVNGIVGIEVGHFFFEGVLVVCNSEIDIAYSTEEETRKKLDNNFFGGFVGFRF